MSNDTMENPSEPIEPQENIDIRTITEQIGKLYESLKSMVATSQTAGKPMDGATEEKYSRMNSRLSALISMRDQHYRLLDATAQATRAVGSKIETMSATKTSGRRGDQLAKFFAGDEYRSTWGKYLRTGTHEMTREERAGLNEGVEAEGGYLPATEFLSTLITKRFQANAMRQIMNVVPLGTFETEVIYEDTIGASSYIAEASGATEVTPAFAQVVLKPHTLRYFTKVSNELLADSPSRGAAFNVESVLASQIGRSMGEAEERKFCTGTGTAQPWGIYTMVGATRSISETITATNNIIVQADLLNCIAALPRQYRDGAKWIMGDSMFYKIRQLLTGTFSAGYAPFAWSLGDGKLQDGEPDRLLGYPVVCVNDGLAYPAAGTKRVMAMFGNFDYFHLGEREGVSVKVAKEVYLANNQTGFFAFARHGTDVSQLAAFNALAIKGA